MSRREQPAQEQNMTRYLRDLVHQIGGPCASPGSMDIITMSDVADHVTLRGPANIVVSVEMENIFSPVAAGAATPVHHMPAELYSFAVQIPAGSTWGLEMRRWIEQGSLPPRCSLVIRGSPCTPAPPVQCPDVPCDFAVRHLPDCGHVFPVGCEPRGSGPVRMPPTCGPALTVIPADGGCIRPCFFNGMFITREDMETQLRYFRIKNQLQRRADGQGVVWGLGLRREGRSICVYPGYAVDCCGNDLIVTCMYKVDAAALLMDPIICNHRHGERQCFALLLEYVECPEEPRPVHPEPCFGGAMPCEMSRVRETVRLRLVPPRECKPARPIPDFLKKLCEPGRRPDCDPPEPPKCEPFPCLTDPCCDETPLFSPPIPWCDEDPFNRGESGDLKAIALAIVYALLAGTIAKSEPGANGADNNVAAAADVFALVTKLFDEKLAEHDRLDDVAIAVQQLLSDWCCSLLYPGPCCEGEPHGVVIGCAVVCGGEIERIDPWGGRRWVMHYPLQSYWGAQFGIVPPDIMASRVFGLICCLARLHPPACGPLCSSDNPRSEMTIGGCKLGVNTGTAQRSQTSRKQVVSLATFVEKVLAAVAQPDMPDGKAMVELQIDGLPDVYILVPDQSASATPMRPSEELGEPPVDQPVRQVRPRTAAPPRPWIEVLVQEALAVARIRRIQRGQPLLRGFTERLSIRLAESQPLAALTPPRSRELAEALEDAAILTIGTLLQQSPETLATDLGEAVAARALSELIQRSESRVQAITDAAIERVQAATGERGLVSVGDLAKSPEALGELIETLVGRLEMPRDTVERCVSEALAS
jgi:hypothetical protein